tara:strand:+ start:1886 stop:2422 length:537 start_codon:yes stop_codon:yes gene_type:complete
MTEPKLVMVFEPSKTTHWKNLFPNKMLLLGSQNLNPGEELIAEILGVDIEEIKDANGGVESVPIMTFTNAPPMVLNITNTKTISNLYGEHYDKWPGRSIQIFATKIKAFGAVNMALRIREAIPDTNENIDEFEKKLRACPDIETLKTVYLSIPTHLKPRLAPLKDEIKDKLTGAANAN